MPALKKPDLVSVTSINRDGSRYFIHPADVKGWFTLGRRVFGVLLVAIYVLLPWIPIGGNPAVFFDLLERRFHFFGLTFLSEDLWIGFFLLTGLGFSLFYVTSLLGRIWCGWACPYTVFLEHVYRRIERVIDGDASQRRKLSESKRTPEKTVRAIVKHSLYLIVSIVIAHVFISYFISIPRLYLYMQGSPAEHFKAFGVMLFLTGALYFSFSWFREQFCLILCPYGRIQSALTDEDTIIIGYDSTRGEPRGKVTDEGAGDCINCMRCVQVFPTGIDIRNGLQMECIGCAGCIDACNEIMDKTNRPRGLVRYDSMRGLAGLKTRFVRPRTILYTGLLCLGAAVMLIFLSGLRPAKVELIRMPGSPYYVDETGVRNQFRLQLLTKENEETTFTFRSLGLPEGAVVSGLEEPVILKPGEETNRTVLITVPVASYSKEFEFSIEASVQPGGFQIDDSAEFLGPSAYTLSPETPASPAP
jgi:cytochrome c oxidase accessory protein FixG